MVVVGFWKGRWRGRRRILTQREIGMSGLGGE